MLRNLPRLAASFLPLLLWAPVGVAQQIVSDEFNGTSLDESVWVFVNPLGDGQFSVGGGQLMVSVPGGVAHDAWTSGLEAPRLVQYVSDQDFEIEVKFDSSVTQRFQLQGVAVEDESGAFVRADFHYDGTRTRVFTAVVQGGSASVKANVRLKGVVAPMYLRLARAGDVWTHRYSFDGETWQTAATFTHAMTMNAVGVYGGNAGSPAPSHLALVDHFINLASPPGPDPEPEPEPGYTLSVSVSGEGSVSRSPDQPSYAVGSVVELTALPAAGWSFAGWSGQLSGTANPATVTINENTSISANFVVAPVPEYTLTVGTVGEGTVTLDPPGGTYPEGTEVALQAIAADGWTFAGWSGALSGTANPATLVVDASHEVMAMFEALPEPEPEPEYTLSLSVSGEGSVSRSPDQPSYAAGSVVELTALPAAGWSFAGWSGQLSGTANPASVTINENTSISASFVVAPVPEYTLTVRIVGEGTVTLDPPGGTYPAGTEVALQAIAADGWTFAGWSGALSGTANPATLMVSASHEVIATFDFVPEPVAPVILGVTVDAQADRAVVSWSTDVPTSGSVDYGLSDAYGAGTLLSLGWTTSHEVTVADLAPETTYHLRVVAASEAGLESQSGDITFTTSAVPSTTGQIISDNFNGTSLDESVWAFVNPVGDGQFSVGGGQLMVSVPGGVAHDAWTAGLDAPRLVQYVSDQDFEIEVKFDSSVTQRFQLQGVAVEDEAGAFVRADFTTMARGRGCLPRWCRGAARRSREMCVSTVRWRRCTCGWPGPGMSGPTGIHLTVRPGRPRRRSRTR
jgi:regulation of enolase protein 1 (concanavalin A-like superfamily)